MKNVTIALDDETHRRARVRAAEMGTSLSALVKDYLQSLGNGTLEISAATPVEQVVREMPMPFHSQPTVPADGILVAVAPVAPISTHQSKPRKAGALKGKIWIADDFDQTPDWLIDAFEGKDGHLPWPDPA